VALEDEYPIRTVGHGYPALTTNIVAAGGAAGYIKFERNVPDS